MVNTRVVREGTLTDNQLTAGISKALKEYCPVTAKHDISVTANNGLVFLAGSVPLFELRNIAEDVSTRVVGIRGFRTGHR